ncbi:MAG: phosphatase [Deltaproteobacteria bacterium RIFOXYA12_FULL_61_11]|nr:MAG: phosphatase [Deltaproteobacteria bacterium RIFOXYA12_FULL_61_11]
MVAGEVRMQPQVLVLDVDGVLTTGQFLYTAEGKVMKVFGPDDHDALMLLRRHLPVHAVTGDRRGLPITRCRVEHDMGLPLELVGTTGRVEWIAGRYDLDRTIYMGDGIFDGTVFKAVGYAIATADALPQVKARAHFVTTRRGGERAVAEACLHLLERFYGLSGDPADLLGGA